MKKYIGFLVVLSIFVLGGSKAQAITNPNNTPCASTATPSITVLSPNGGEVYQAGQQVEVKWNNCNVPSNSIATVAVYSNVGGGYSYALNPLVAEDIIFEGYAFTQNDGVEVFNLPNHPSYKGGLAYKIYIAVGPLPNSAQNFVPIDTDFSDNLFTINSSEVAPFIKVLSPNGGETYQAGQPINIFLSGGLYMTRVGLIYPDFNPNNEINDGNDVHWLSVTSNAGQNFVWNGSSFIDNNGNPNYWTAGTGNYKIVAIKDVNEDKCYINKISDCIFDTSDNPFTIDNSVEVAPTIKVLYPNGGETFNLGQKINVTWKTTGFSNNANVGIDLTQKIGTTYSEIRALSQTKNDGSEIVTIPTDISPRDNYIISVGLVEIGVSNQQIVDRSDSTFTIKSSLSSILPVGCTSSVGFSSTTGLPCFLDTNPATSITSNKAVLNGRIFANTPANLYFNYKKAGNGNEMFTTPTIYQQGNGLFSSSLSGLMSNTKYEFKACMPYGNLASTCSKLINFTTSASSIDDIIEDNGCSNGEKYSSTTGQMCTEYGCKHGEKYSSTTGQVCPVIPEVVDNGCNGTVYSTTTGKLCGTCSASGTGCYRPSYVETNPILIYPLGCTSLEGVSSVTGMACKACSISGAEGCSTKTETNKLITPLTRILKIGVKGEDVKLIQEILGLKADGIFGNMTASKVKEWQASKDLKVDGMFGPASFGKINQ